MKIVSRAYNSDEDFTSVVTFLHETFKKTNSYQNWFPERFENSHRSCGNVQWVDDIRIWEDTNEVKRSRKWVVAVANPESPFDYFIQIDPSYSFLEQEILEWIEKHCLERKKDSVKTQRLRIHTIEGNPARELLLAELGYQKGEIAGYLRLRPVDLPLPHADYPERYEIRSIGGKSDYDQLAAVTRLVFGHGEWFNAEVYEEITRCSFYKQDLDLVAVAPDGTFVSFCTFRMDPISRITALEPMGTHPSHRRQGLAKALIVEGVKRAMKYNPTLFYIGGAIDTFAANRLYDSVGFTEKFAECCWQKEI
ncbi:MAG: GNAT family N-acetyltransferase [Candidatus Bathyarchaeota archaeon]|nr:MAG: GNAT family N-acetyltransferase [Candidatus Bathyarchaeota archaeon]